MICRRGSESHSDRYDAKLFTPLITGSTFILKDFELKIAFVDFGKTYVRSPTLETSNVAPVSAASAFNAFCVSYTLAPEIALASPTVAR